ncbi:MAG: hypothetical protein V8Q16_00195 [Akkermansia muciniphila]
METRFWAPADNQQDSFSILVGEDALLLVLADGMGGYTGGELASRAAVEGFSRAFEREYPVSRRANESRSDRCE